jgi:RNA polymerase sigma-32 factor
LNQNGHAANNNGGVMGQSEQWVERAIRNQLQRSNLTAERERQLLQLTRSGGNANIRQAALSELWESHSKLVVAIASRSRRPDIDLLDLVGAGHLGLHTAIERFDLMREDTRLSSYAAGWIRWFIQDYIRRNRSPVRLPGSVAHRQLAQMSGRLLADAQKACLREAVEPTEVQLCERIGRRIGLPADDVARSLRLIQGGTLSLTRYAGDEGRSLVDTLHDEEADAENDAIFRLDHTKIRSRIMALAEEILGERERMVFLSRCMTDREDMVPLERLAARFNVSKERIFQLEVSAKNKIATVLFREGYIGLAGDQDTLKLAAVRTRRRRTAALEDPCEQIETTTATG